MIDTHVPTPRPTASAASQKARARVDDHAFHRFSALVGVVISEDGNGNLCWVDASRTSLRRHNWRDAHP